MNNSAKIKDLLNFSLDLSQLSNEQIVEKVLSLLSIKVDLPIKLVPESFGMTGKSYMLNTPEVYISVAIEGNSLVKIKFKLPQSQRYLSVFAPKRVLSTDDINRLLEYCNSARLS